MMGLLALPFVLLAFSASIQPLSAPVQAELNGRFWHSGCPVPLARLRVLTVTHWGFDGRAHTGQLVVNQDAAAPLARVFRQLYELRFPIRHMRLADVYGPSSSQPADGDLSGSFECRQAVPSPCSGGTGTGSWSEHAYGEAVDLNTIENPYVGCGRTRERSSLPVPQPLPATPRDGDACRRRGLPLDRLGLGRQLDRLDQGLHALLRQRPLAHRPPAAGLSTRCPCAQGRGSSRPVPSRSPAQPPGSPSPGR